MKFIKGLTRFFHFGATETARQSVAENTLTRRGLLMGLGASLVVAAMPEIPLGRVWSIPKKIVYPPGMLTPEILRRFSDQMLAAMGPIEPVYYLHPAQYATLQELIGGDPAKVSEMVGHDDFGQEATTGQMIHKMRVRQAKYAAYWRGDQFVEMSGPEWDDKPVNIIPGADLNSGIVDIHIPSPTVEAGKVSRLLDRYGNALTSKLERTIVEPVRNELEDVLDLVV